MRSYRNRQPDPQPRRKRRPLVWWTILAAGLLVIAAGIWASRSWWRDDPEPWLEQARADLVAVVADETAPARRIELARDADSLLTRYLEADGAEHDVAQLLLASTLLVLDRNDEAGTLLDEYDPAPVPTADIERTATIAFRKQQFGLADALIGEALEREDHRKETLRTAIEIRYDLGRDEDVLTHIRELRTLVPDDPRPLLAATLVYEDRGDWDHVIDTCREFLRLQPEGADEVRLMLLDAYLTLGNTDEASREFETIRSKAPDLLEQLPMLEARLLNLKGQNAEALERVGKILSANPSNPDALLLRGRIELAQGHFDEAKATLKELTKVDPSNFEAHYLLGQALSRSGDPSQARRELDLHQKLLDARVQIHLLERRAGQNPADVEVRRELEQRYRDIGLEDLADFWARAAKSAEE